ncbi:MAG: inorganic pyrophosphatase [Myxococcales bacterium]|nr:inorganic pyrophosphatase [Myxococcales bacterium]MDP3505919.1 inorganic pyrophosphatase [Myxococcales bacterium]
MTPSLTQAFGLFFQAHPWHGVSPGEHSPDIVTSYIEMVPTDAVKYEVDKATGILKLDRPQRFSSQPPSLYGFIPRTYCHTKVGARCSERVGRPGIQGDGDPMDICVLTEKPIQHGAILIEAIPIGGLRMIDGSQADDKIIAVLKGDSVYGGWKDVADVPPQLIDRLRHYFLTYKQSPDAPKPTVEIAEVYGREEALETIKVSLADYDDKYGQLQNLFGPNR